MSFLASRTGKRDGPPGTIKTTTTPRLSTIDEVVTESGQSLVPNQVATTSPTADAAAWPSLHFATCACETCEPSTSNDLQEATPTSLYNLSSAVPSAPRAPTRAQPAPRRPAIADPAELRKKALRQAMQCKLKGKSLATLSSPHAASCGAQSATPSTMLHGVPVQVDSEVAAAAKARMEGEWHVRWLATEYLRWEAGYSL